MDTSVNYSPWLACMFTYPTESGLISAICRIPSALPSYCTFTNNVVHMHTTTVHYCNTQSVGYWHMHSLYGQFQFGVLWIVDHIRLHFNLPWETIEVIRDLALGLIIIPLILQTKPGEEGEGGRGGEGGEVKPTHNVTRP